jgi:hypothetical protein
VCARFDQLTWWQHVHTHAVHATSVVEQMQLLASAKSSVNTAHEHPLFATY